MFEKKSILLRLFAPIVVLLVLLALLISAPAPTLSQNSEAAFVSQVIQNAVRVCDGIGQGEICYGNPQVAATFQEGSEGAFAEIGDVSATQTLQSLTSQPADEDSETWGITFLRLGAGLPKDSDASVAMVALGDVEMTNTAVPAEIVVVCEGKNLSTSALNIFSEPDFSSAIIAELSELEKISVNGRNTGGDFFRVERGGALGWISADNVAIDCEADKLLVGEAGDSSVLYTEPMQAVSLETGSDQGTAATPNGLLLQAPLGETAQLLINGVQINSSGAGFITAAGEELTIVGLQGKIDISAGGKTVTILPGSVTHVPLAALTASGQPDDPEPADETGSLTDLLNSLINGQPYVGTGSTVSGFSIQTSAAPTAPDSLVRVNMHFTGDAATCPAESNRPFLDVVFALDTSDAMKGANLNAARASIGRFIEDMNPDIDQVGIVTFSGQATTRTPLTPDFESAIDGLSEIKTENARAIDLGLAEAYRALKGGRSGAASQAIVLLTAGNSDAVLAGQVATEIKNAGIRLIAVGLGEQVDSQLLQSLATKEDVLLANSAVNIPDVVQMALFKLTQPVAARDLKLTFSVDSDQFAVVDDLLPLSGGVLNGDTIEWNVPVVWNTQTIDFPVALKAVNAGETSPGSAELSYTGCADGGANIQSNEIAVPVISVAADAEPSKSVKLNTGVLAEDSTGSGTLAAFEQQLWAVEAPDAQTISITTDGTEGALKTLLTGADGTLINPLYTLENADGSPEDLSVFFVPEGGVSWLYLQSDSPLASGNYTVRIDSGAIGNADRVLVPDGELFRDQQASEGGQLYTIDGNVGDTVTFRYTAQEVAPLESPLRVFSLDGQSADEIFTQFDATTNQWVSLQTLQGSGPFQVLVRSGSPYTIGVESGDTLTNARGSIAIGEVRNTDAKTSTPAVFSYSLDVPEDRLVSVVLSGSATQSTLRNAENQVVALNDRLEVNDFRVDFYNLTAGSYTMLVPTRGAFGIAVADGDVTRSLKGTLGPGQTRDEFLGSEVQLAVYNVVEGSGKPLAEGDMLTVTLDAENVDRNTIYVESSDGARSELPVEPIIDVLDRRTKRLVSVHELKGVGPYRIIALNQNDYIIRLDRGDLLTNDKGSIVIGQSARDSSRAPQYLIYTLTPELGKGLIEGDVLTVSFLNQANSEKPFFRPFVEDGKKSAVLPQVDYLDENARQFIGVYELAGAPPYRLIIPNIGAYELSVEIGNQLELDRGAVEIGEPARGATDGPQLVHYILDAEEGQIITTKVGITQGGGNFSTVTLVDAGGTELSTKRLVNDGKFNQVYVLNGQAPYTLSFQMDGVYELSISEGDLLTLDKGDFFIGDAEAGEVKQELGVQLVTYRLNLQAGQTITTQLFNENFYEYELFDPNGDRVEYSWRWFSRDTSRQYNQQRVYTVRDAGVYELAFPMAGKYTVRVSDGNQLNVVKGNVFFDVQETDRLPGDKRFASYTINGQQGQLITLEYIATNTSQGSLESAQIIDADGNLVYETTFTEETGYKLILYTLQGAAPYTLTIEPRGEYKLKISDGDTLNLDRGVLPFGQEITDTPVPEGTPANAPKYLKRFQYTIDAEPGDQVTVQLTQPQNSATLGVRMFDGSLTEILPNVTDYDSGPRLYALSYTLTGDGPYQFWFDVKDEFKITLNRGDLLTSNQGILPYNEVIESELEEPAVVASYIVLGAEGDIVSFAVSQQSEPLFTNANGELVTLVDQVFGTRGILSVYQLLGPAPYTLQFRVDRRYEAALVLGNVLNANLGTLAINSARDLANPEYEPVTASGRLEDPALNANFSIAGAAGDMITLRLEAQGSSLSPLLFSSDGTFIDPQISSLDNNTFLAVYQLAGEAPYTLAFDAPNQYEVQLDEGDTLRFDAGTIPTGILEEPYTNELPETARFAVHTLDVAPGELVTLQIENGRNLIPVDLRDGNGKVLEPEFTDFQGSANNVNVYILSGSGPYMATFPVDGEYTAIVETLNLLRVDKGIIPFGTPVEDELADPGRVATYLVDGKAGQTVSIQLQAGNRPVDGEFRDANGKLWLPEYQVTQNNALYNVYLLGGPGPYDIAIGSDQKYALAVSDGNILRADLGNIPLGEEISNTLTAPSQTAIYSVNGQPGEIISVALQVSGRAAESSLYNADGDLLRPVGIVEKNNTAYSVYTLAGTAPYRLEFVAPRQYKVTVTPGNVLRAELGSVTLSERVSATLPSPAQTAIYSVDVQPGQFLSVQLQVSGKPADSILFDASGEQLEPDADLEKLNSTFNIYTLSGEGPYRLEFDAASQYNLIVTPGNVLRADQGVIRFGNTVTTTLKEPAEAAIYTIDGQPGQVISVQLQDNNRPIDSELRDAGNNLILPWGQVKTSSAVFNVYTLSGAAPYKITFLPAGRYSLTLKPGNFFRAELGVIPFGQKVTNTLPVPARTAVYTLNTEADQVISAQIVNRSGRVFVEAKLVNADGEEIEPQTEIFDGTNTSTSVYLLAGPAPYTFEFDVTGQYDITFSRGDVSDPDFVPVGPQSAPQTPG